MKSFIHRVSQLYIPLMVLAYVLCFVPHVSLLVFPVLVMFLGLPVVGLVAAFTVEPISNASATTALVVKVTSIILAFLFLLAIGWGFLTAIPGEESLGGLAIIPIIFFGYPVLIISMIVLFVLEFTGRARSISNG